MRIHHKLVRTGDYDINGSDFWISRMALKIKYVNCQCTSEKFLLISSIYNKKNDLDLTNFKMARSGFWLIFLTINQLCNTFFHLSNKSTSFSDPTSSDWLDFINYNLTIISFEWDIGKMVVGSDCWQLIYN
jgi:hypothetical protein